jgi:nitrate/TMAO reductase-like tetraheme cytochrome c subunit
MKGLKNKKITVLLILISLIFFSSVMVKAATGDVENCFKCHESETAEWKKGPHATTLSDLKNDDQMQEECLKCHSSDYQLSSENNKPTMEEVKHGVNCLSCHNDDPNLKTEGRHSADYESLLRPELGLCVDCHSALVESEAKPGERVDNTQQNIFYGFGGINVDPQPSEKARVGITCNDCHMLPKEEGAEKAHNYQTVLPGEGSPNSCINGDCHRNFSGSLLSGVMNRWQEETKELLADVKEELEAKEEYKDTEPYKIALTNYLFVKEDKSYGVHNIYYVRDLLWEAEDQLESIEENFGNKQE